MFHFIKKINLFKIFLDFILSKFIIYTKILQWINFDSVSFIPKFIKKYLRNFLDRTPYVISDINYTQIENLKNKCLEEGYELEIKNLPERSGTIALVFFCNLRNIKNNTNEKVVVKILRKDIKQKIKNAIFVFSLISSFLKKIRYIDITKCVADISDDLLLQCDCKNEIENIKKIYRALKNYKISKQPSVYENLSHEEYIVMEYIEGENIKDIDRNELKNFSIMAAKVFFHLTFIKSIMHIDSHPGNLLFFKNSNNDYKVTYLDLGMCLYLTTEEVNFIAEMVGVLYGETDCEKLKKTLKRSSKVFCPKQEIDFNIIDDLFKNNKNIFKRKNVRNISEDLRIFLNFFHNNNVQISKRANCMILSLVSFFGLCDILNQEEETFRKEILQKIEKNFKVLN